MVAVGNWALLLSCAAIVPYEVVGFQKPLSGVELHDVNAESDPDISKALDGVALAEAIETAEVAESRSTPEGKKGYETVEHPKETAKPPAGTYKPPGWFRRLLHRLHLAEDDTCLRMKEAGLIPQSKNSPLKKFGYVTFDVNTRKHTVSAGLPLSLVNGFPVPIKVGTRDYVVQGSVGKVLLFLECFSAYDIRGSFLGEDGHWHDSQQTENPLFIQVENTGPEAFGSVKHMIVQHSVEQLLRAIAPTNIFIAAAAGAVAKIPVAKMAKAAAQTVATKWLYLKHVYHLAGVLDMNAKEVEKAWEEIGEKPTFAEKAKTFYGLLKEGRKKREREKWLGQENIKLSKNITMTITMYPHMEHGIRATRALSSNLVKVEEVFRAMTALLTRTAVDVVEAIAGEDEPEEA